MKKTLLIICILLYSAVALSQKKNNISVQGDISYYYHFFGSSKNLFNYGFSLLVFNSFKSVKAGFGIDYATKFYYFNVEPEASNNYLNKKENKLQYIDFPILVYIGNDFKKQFHASAMLGLVLNKLIKYEVNSYYEEKAPVYETKNTQSNIGLTLRLGAEISKKLGRHVFLNITPFGDYKFVQTKGDNEEIPDNNISLGIHAGVEYFF